MAAHEARSTGARSEADRQRCTYASTGHGLDTRELRYEQALGMCRLRELEDFGHLRGIMSRMRKPERKPTLNLSTACQDQ